jgi:hypothetical protein
MGVSHLDCGAFPPLLFFTTQGAVGDITSGAPKKRNNSGGKAPQSKSGERHRAWVCRFQDVSRHSSTFSR